MNIRRVSSTIVLLFFTALMFFIVYQTVFSSINIDYAKIKSEKFAREEREQASLELRTQKEREEQNRRYEEDTKRELARRKQVGSPTSIEPSRSDIENQIRTYDPEKQKWMREALCSFYKTC